MAQTSPPLTFLGGVSRGRRPKGSPDGLPMSFLLALASGVGVSALANGLTLAVGETLFSRVLTLALYCLFAGIGVVVARRWEERALVGFFTLSLGGAVLGGLSGFALLEIAASFRHPFVSAVAMLLFLGTLGALAGTRVPFLYWLCGKQRKDTERLGWYLGVELAGFWLGYSLAPLLVWRLGVAGAEVSASLLSVTALAVFLFRTMEFPWRRPASIALGLTAIGLVVLLTGADRFERDADARFFQASSRTTISRNVRTRHHKIVLTLTPAEDVEPEEESLPDYNASVKSLGGKPGQDRWISIFVDGFLQALSPVESKTDFFHHAFVHPAMALAGRRAKVLVLGGGDGLAVKEVLKYDELEKVVSVEKDAEWLSIAKTDPLLRLHNYSAFEHPKSETVVADPFLWVRQSNETFDVILVDFPETVDFRLSQSYSTEFLRDLKRLLSPDGVISFQVVYFDNPVFWCVVNTMLEAGYSVVPHHTLDPSGFSGLLLASRRPLELKAYDKRLRQYPWIDPSLLLAAEALEYYRQDDILRARSQGLRLNTFLRPSFFSYYPAGLSLIPLPEN